MSRKDTTYAEAAAELNAIVADLERGDTDIDVLGAKVRRASELIALCRAKLRGAEVEVEKALGSLDVADQVRPDRAAASKSGASAEPRLPL